MKPRLQGNVSAADHWILDRTNLQAGRPFGSNPQLSSSSTSYESAGTDNAVSALISSPWSGVNDNISVFINPNFMGRLLVTYQVTLPTGTAYADPVLTPFGTLSLDSTLFASTQKI